jgi:hypothetical protein
MAIDSSLDLKKQVKAFPFFKGKTELVPMNIGIGDERNEQPKGLCD